MRIQIVSDLHLEFTANREWLHEHPIARCADVLLIAGDSFCLNNPAPGASFLQSISKDYQLIISTLGNHEFYGSDIGLAYPSYHKVLTSNHHCLNNEVYVYGNYRFLCSVLWSNVPEAHRGDVGTRLNDYHHIRTCTKAGANNTFTVEDSNHCHRLSLDFIRKELSMPFDGQTIILTHHLPSYQCVPHQFRGSKLVSGFASDLDDLILANPQVSHWFYGHAHDFHQIRVGITMLIRNPLGYVEQDDHQDFRSDFYVDV